MLREVFARLKYGGIPTKDPSVPPGGQSTVNLLGVAK